MLGLSFKLLIAGFPYNPNYIIVTIHESFHQLWRTLEDSDYRIHLKASIQSFF
jgi:hypothetical protein